MPFQIIRQDITKLAVDAIVNAANIHLRMGNGVCDVIFKAATIQRHHTLRYLLTTASPMRISNI